MAGITEQIKEKAEIIGVRYLSQAFEAALA